MKPPKATMPDEPKNPIAGDPTARALANSPTHVEAMYERPVPVSKTPTAEPVSRSAQAAHDDVNRRIAMYKRGGS